MSVISPLCLAKLLRLVEASQGLFGAGNIIHVDYLTLTWRVGTRKCLALALA